MHFFRALWENDLDSAGFTVKNTANVKLDNNNFVIQTDSLTKYLKYRRNLFVTYFTKWPGSTIVMIKEYVYFDKNGYFDPLGISWEGEMAKQRIADILPFEYSIK